MFREVIFLIKRFIKYYKPYKGMFALDMLASLLISIIGMSYPILTNTVLDEIVPSETLVMDEKIKFIVIFGVALLLCYVISLKNNSTIY